MKALDKFEHLHIRDYKQLRQTVGFIGMSLPFVLVLGDFVFFDAKELETSVSYYYHTGMQNVFVGAMCAVGLFMFFYCGYDQIDNWVGNIAGIAAIGVAWFRTTPHDQELDDVGIAHFVFAGVFFIMLIIFSFLFTKTKDGEKAVARKWWRNKVYILCGIGMIACMIAIVIYKNTGHREETSFVYWGEAIALLFFGISWFIKGETFGILKDKNEVKGA